MCGDREHTTSSPFCYKSKSALKIFPKKLLSSLEEPSHSSCPHPTFVHFISTNLTRSSQWKFPADSSSGKGKVPFWHTPEYSVLPNKIYPQTQLSCHSLICWVMLDPNLRREGIPKSCWIYVRGKKPQLQFPLSFHKGTEYSTLGLCPTIYG